MYHGNVREISLSYCERITNKSEQMQRRFGNKSNIKTTICSAITIEREGPIQMCAHSEGEGIHAYERTPAHAAPADRQTSSRTLTQRRRVIVIATRHKHHGDMAWNMGMHSTVRACWNERKSACVLCIYVRRVFQVFDF